MAEALSLVPSKTDAEMAQEIRAELRPLLEQIASIMGRARKSGMNIGWAIGWDNYGRAVINQIDVNKPL
jgi:hypothetical protein